MSGNIDIWVSGQKVSGNKCTAWCNSAEPGKWTVNMELTMSWDDRDTLFDGTMAGFVSERDLGLGNKDFYDTTYCSGNTIILKPKSDSGLSDLFDETTIVVRSLEDSPINEDNVAVRISGERLS